MKIEKTETIIFKPEEFALLSATQDLLNEIGRKSKEEAAIIASDAADAIQKFFDLETNKIELDGETPSNEITIKLDLYQK